MPLAQRGINVGKGPLGILGSEPQLHPSHDFFFNFYLFIIVTHTHREREREAETQAEGEAEAGSMHREPDVGLDPRSSGLRPGPKAGAKPLHHSGILHNLF